MTKIEWAATMKDGVLIPGKTWNPVTGCNKISPGCKNCYAERMANRLQHNPIIDKYRNGFKVTLHPDELTTPLKWAKSKTIFVCSMADLFHADVPIEFIARVFAVMGMASQHTFQVLTKRPERMSRFIREGPGLIADAINQLYKDGHLNRMIDLYDAIKPMFSNVWLGTSVETVAYYHRIDTLRQVNAWVNFLSLEPLLGPMPNLDLTGIDWVIVGGESGPGARPMHPDWVRDIRDQCVAQGVAFFFKQWGGVHKGKTGRELDGRTWDEMPGVR